MRGGATPEEVLARLDGLRALDAPTHGGRLSPRLRLGARRAGRARGRGDPPDAARQRLDPTTFRSVAVIERELVGFARRVFHGGGDVVGTATSGGTESCLLAVKTARDAWRARGGTGRPRLVAPTTVHAAFRKAAALLDLDLDLVSVDPAPSLPEASAVAARLGSDVALAVVSAPSYPHAGLDPVAEVAGAALAAGVDLHVDACIGGFALAFWPDGSRAPHRGRGTSASPASRASRPTRTWLRAQGRLRAAQRGRDRQRSSGSRRRLARIPGGEPDPARLALGCPLAAAWAIVQALGEDGFRELTASMARSTAALVAAVRGIEGLTVGEPSGRCSRSPPIPRRPRSARRPHRWADAMRRGGFAVQHQPASRQPDGTVLRRRPTSR